MSLITIYGANPFAGQSDPYVAMDAAISYDESPDGVVTQSYTLNGTLTGCSKQELNSLRDALVASFDWRADPEIPKNIKVAGLINASEDNQITPTSLSFDSSNYLGALPYTIQLEIFTGYDYGFDETDEEDLIDQTHTISTSIAEDGCITISTAIGCAPNLNATGCGALEAANDWVTQQLGSAKGVLGAITQANTYTLNSESLTINPLTSAVSYSSTESNCKDGKQDTIDAGGWSSEPQLVYCITTNEGGSTSAACGDEGKVVTTSYDGEVYKSGALESELISKLNSELLSTLDGIQKFSADYKNTEDSITFKFETLEDGNGAPLYVPMDVIINDYTLTQKHNYDDGLKDGSVGGNVFVLNPVELTPFAANSYDVSTMKARARSLAGPDAKITSNSITYNETEGGLNYSFGFVESKNTDNNNEDKPAVDGVTGISNWGITFSPPLRLYETVASMSCEDFIFDKGYNSRGSIGVTVNSTSGSGYDFVAICATKGRELVNSIASNRSDLRVNNDGVEVDKTSASFSYNASFAGKSAVDKNQINSLQ